MTRALRGLAVLVVALTAALAPHTAAALPLLSEVFYDAAGSDDGLSFVEIFGAPGASLDGWVLEGVNGANGAVGPSLLLSGVVPVDGVFVVADSASGGGTSVTNADLVLNFDFQNGPDSVVLRDDGGLAIDAVGYGDFDPGEVFAGEGAPAPDAPADSSLARLFADVDTDDNAADWIVLGTPTPGLAPVSSVPEPGTAALLGTGLASLAVLGRRRSSG